ncbi:MAG: Glycosyltransferase, probably involved in cell wall biogenesis [Candidatus Woesebacteria bacterium GW2011_GWB1_43_14]|uniref:Glycosyltransferase, probably involved in cell wall biogenesis n=1 Tax=Candidatus Woesebacteria bacterium GW2011_GWB1_43_14 TaxID=1618578 RepID=A0A0G1GEI1_9BACT|nr:MAG: Glycosyltransferase, probably involved in cell wall biogenesis [Candidatus Woesebacteria bacterium GW2011_GWA1_39_11b]KKS78309.1 MAG: Glycosyltransferase, probably involved in cell wall biogenesis [Candidatus Woesebacteria bacterium GW2011_GWC1_42_9]KKS97273.1 MAG: Glycosyltransferase, probably involved in cell wall biogenesis [Candidatus Woesebacteria bacterium GW2011_GWB1_43_14]
MRIDALSVFFPAYNEEANITKTVREAVNILPKVAKKWEVIIVNDGSKDGTEKVSRKLARSNKNIHVITHKKNRGYGAAVKSGLYGARYHWIAFTDSDGQFDFSEITKFIHTQKNTGADLVIGFYKNRKVSGIRKINSQVWQLIVFLLFGLRVRDIDCAFKLISKEVVDTIPKLESERGAFISSEFLIKAKKNNFKIVEIGVTHYARKEGSATGAGLDVIIKSFLDLARLWKKLR